MSERVSDERVRHVINGGLWAASEERNAARELLAARATLAAQAEEVGLLRKVADSMHLSMPPLVMQWQLVTTDATLPALEAYHEHCRAASRAPAAAVAPAGEREPMTPASSNPRSPGLEPGMRVATPAAGSTSSPPPADAARAASAEAERMLCDAAYGPAHFTDLACLVPFDIALSAIRAAEQAAEARTMQQMQGTCLILDHVREAEQAATAAEYQRIRHRLHSASDRATAAEAECARLRGEVERLTQEQRAEIVADEMAKWPKAAQPARGEMTAVRALVAALASGRIYEPDGRLPWANDVVAAIMDYLAARAEARK